MTLEEKCEKYIMPLVFNLEAECRKQGTPMAFSVQCSDEGETEVYISINVPKET